MSTLGFLAGAHPAAGTWHGPGQLLGQDGGNWWLLHDGRVLRAADRQLRPASLGEEYTARRSREFLTEHTRRGGRAEAQDVTGDGEPSAETWELEEPTGDMEEDVAEAATSGRTNNTTTCSASRCFQR